MSGKSVRLGVIGLGTVGRGVVQILEKNRRLIERRAGGPVEIARVAVRDVRRDRGVRLPDGVLTADAWSVVRAADVDVVVELIGGCSPARDLVLAAMEAGKHVITANKALLAEHGAEIRRAAERQRVHLGFEASVAGGIPVIKTLREALAGNQVLSIYGIVNGTCNYILTKMSDEGREFASVLREAQAAGYAEADPVFDVGGIDSAHKLAILVNLAFGAPVDLDQIFTEGITAITPVDIEFGREFGYTLKLLAIAKLADGRIEARVHPTLVPDEYAIAKVRGVYNAVEIVGDAVGDLMLYGRGAGDMPTASAVWGDIIDVCRLLRSGAAVIRADGVDAAPLPIKPVEDIVGPFYLRVMVEDRPGVLSQISGILGRHNISIESVLQKGRDAGRVVSLVIMTHTASERDVQAALVEINALDCVSDRVVLIRVEAGI